MKKINLDKPDIREKSLKFGMSYPFDEELVMLILGSGSKQVPIEMMSEKIIDVLDCSDANDIVKNLMNIKGVGESKNTTHSLAIKCDMFEAICGAIFVDSGIDAVEKFFIKAVGARIEDFKKHGYEDDPKTKLQELLKQAKIVYSTTKSGEDHCPVYKTSVFVNDKKMGTGMGSNKRTAEENAARIAINNIK